jgi:folylpolyglutamate synthase/dihydropteroate synthase
MEGLKNKFVGKKILALFGAGQEKCLKEMITPLMNYSSSVLMVKSKHFKAVSTNELNSMVNDAQNFKLLRTGIEQSVNGGLDFVLENIIRY